MVPDIILWSILVLGTIILTSKIVSQTTSLIVTGVGLIVSIFVLNNVLLSVLFFLLLEFFIISDTYKIKDYGKAVLKTLEIDFVIIIAGVGLYALYCII
ncbi:MAG TPA: hypothetical protein P5513_03965 [Candidatus Diapherotrites archaeon]|nr:hypothetical protein [Candidatus Diapherotrites archaeon]